MVKDWCLRVRFRSVDRIISIQNLDATISCEHGFSNGRGII